MPSVSVCLAVYNGAATLADALQTAIDQSFPIEEILVVDDGSTDGSGEIAEGLGCRVIRQENAGLGAGRKVLVEEARGDFIAFLDHDDFWEPKKIEKQVEAIEATNSVLCHTDCWFHYDNGKIVPRDKIIPQIEHVLDHILPTNWVIASSAVFEREAMLRAGNFIPETVRCSDWYGWLILGPQGNFVHMPEKLVRYSVRSESLANAGYKFHEAQRYLLKDHILPRWDVLYKKLGKTRRNYYRRLIEMDIGIAASTMGKFLDQLDKHDEAMELHKEALRLARTVPRVWTRAIRSYLSG
ncbi:MAG: glycosyltransferase family 2 protein [Fimbriimonadaceae bacterium]|nr:glycosyltransferase family 2 protein [Fimbriimonadaceae bacterium]